MFFRTKLQMSTYTEIDADCFAHVVPGVPAKTLTITFTSFFRRKFWIFQVVKHPEKIPKKNVSDGGKKTKR